MKIVRPIEASGYNMSVAQLWGSGPKWTITCGNCQITFKARIPMTNDPGVPCPHCCAVNKIPVTLG